MMNNPPIIVLTDGHKWFVIVGGLIVILVLSLSYINNRYPDPPKNPEQIASEIKIKEEAKRNGMYQDCLRTIDAYDKAKGTEEKCYSAAYGEEKK